MNLCCPTADVKEKKKAAFRKLQFIEFIPFYKERGT